MPNQGTNRYIVHATGDGTALAEFIAGLPSQPAIRLVEVIGPHDRPHTAVIETDAATALQLQENFRHSNKLMIEPDRPLSLFQ
ncbi:hypothetical protein [Massilia horti]|uniref:Uncharacterized protein n=1 Tax=Massilia horti TaxID=2562153 RepID=A0A4Y9SZX0_9BURK|nr:hypothetical protein [Massilia horti]TFW30913.1 hypothetical protein E4O92_15150 [Massilia horti]